MKLESSTAIAALQLAAKRLGINVSAKTLPITLAVELGHFLIEKEFNGYAEVYDGTGAVDEWMFDFFKTLTDDSAAAEDAVWEFNKALQDTVGISHSEVFDFYKSLANTATALDAYASLFEKLLTDEITAIGDHAYTYLKKVRESIASVAEEDYKDFSKALQNAASLMDAIDTVAFFKNTQDTAGFSDDETFAFAKFLFDNVGATDDIDGAASILDDQEMQYFKFTSDIANLTDTFIRVIAYTREYSDTSNISDTATLLVDKALNSGSLFTDYNLVDFGKLLNDTPILEDSLAIQLTLAPFLDTVGITDIADVVPNKVNLDSASSTDTGSLRSQGYSDFSYFAEDYVGASRTF